jgi:NAD(P)-dependent dehydrogenase (short-subunit alcohol dehydrogenase family)
MHFLLCSIQSPIATIKSYLTIIKAELSHRTIFHFIEFNYFMEMVYMKTTQQDTRPLPPQPKQHQGNKPGKESEMIPSPRAENPAYPAAGKLEGKVAVISGGDSGIGRAVAIAFAKEGANIVISYLNEHDDAADTKKMVGEKGKHCLCIDGDISSEQHCQTIISKTIKAFSKIDILVNNAGEHYPQQSLTDITAEQLEKTFRVNIFSYFYLTKAALPHLQPGSTIINTTSVTAYKGSPELLDYSATKGAIVSFTRSLSLSLIKKGVRVNGVAPGPIWTPLIPASFPDEKVKHFGEQVPMQRAGQPEELAPCYVFLASDDSSYLTGQILHPNGGVIVNG